MKYILVLSILLSLNATGQSLEKGDIMPDIVMNDMNGNPVKLSSLRGKLVLVDFWASWCKPCRHENPEIVRIYKEYKDKEFKNGKGFTVYGVSLDFKIGPWKEAIKKDGLIWPYHVSDLKGWKNAAAVQFGIRGIPQSFLLNGEGKIIAVNPRGKQLEKELKKHEGSSSFLGSLFSW